MQKEMIALLPERIREKVTITATGCWEWTAFQHKGYGRVTYNGKGFRAHRLVYQIIRGPIPEETEIDHLCRNHSCINPFHLEPVTHLENCRRGISGPRQKNKCYCPEGHPYDDENTYVYFNESRGSWARGCKKCRHEAVRRYRHARSYS
ncbi:hypothetical protein ES703_95246 [subsurface metagenome]